MLVDSLMLIYGVRDIFMGLTLYAAAHFRTRQSLGSIVLAGAGIAFVDGLACWIYVKRDEWNHRGYTPMVAVVGFMLLGSFDSA